MIPNRFLSNEKIKNINDFHVRYLSSSSPFLSDIMAELIIFTLKCQDKEYFSNVLHFTAIFLKENEYNKIIIYLN